MSSGGAGSRAFGFVPPVADRVARARAEQGRGLVRGDAEGAGRACAGSVRGMAWSARTRSHEELAVAQARATRSSFPIRAEQRRAVEVMTGGVRLAVRGGEES